jgi:hypothetical protein
LSPVKKANRPIGASLFPTDEKQPRYFPNAGKAFENKKAGFASGFFRSRHF